MAKFFDLFPKIPYDINRQQLTNYNLVTNIFFRTRMLRTVLGNISAYYEHILDDTDTPETLAEKVYGDAEAHWIILYANDIVDPQYDWPLNYKNFHNYIVNKYGSVQAAKTAVHHYEKVIIRTEAATGVVSETRFLIDEELLSDNLPDVPYESYNTLLEGEDLVAEQSVETFNWGEVSSNTTSTLVGGKTVVQITRRESVSVYDYEAALNDAKRTIKVIKPEYYSQIINEFNTLTNFANAPFRRTFV